MDIIIHTVPPANLRLSRGGELCGVMPTHISLNIIPSMTVGLENRLPVAVLIQIASVPVMIFEKDFGRQSKETLPRERTDKRLHSPQLDKWVGQDAEKRPSLISQAISKMVGEVCFQVCKILLM